MIYVCMEQVQWTSELFEEQLKRIPEIRRQHILNQTRPANRYQSLMGWLLLLYAYEQEYGISLPQIQILAHGKPSFQKEDDGYFSISHSDGLVCCALGAEKLGVDVQSSRRVSTGVIARCCNDREIQMLQNVSGKREQDRLFALLWSRKEAMGKWNGLGISQDLQSLGWCEDFCRDGLTGFSCMITSDSALSLCYEGERCSVQERIVTVPVSSFFRKNSG